MESLRNFEYVLSNQITLTKLYTKDNPSTFSHHSHKKEEFSSPGSLPTSQTKINTKTIQSIIKQFLKLSQQENGGDLSIVLFLIDMSLNVMLKYLI